MLVVLGLIEPHEVPEEIVAQVVFNVAGNADQHPAHPELEDGFDESHAQQQAGFLPGKPGKAREIEAG